MDGFDADEAKKFLLAREQREKERLEQLRKSTLEKTITLLKETFQGSFIEVYLVGSIVRPFQFNTHSDIDIVLKNFQGDYFEMWSQLSLKFDQPIEIILFETCHFQEFITQHGLKVV